MTPKEQAAMQQALEALELARGSHGVMLMSNPPHDAWQYRGCDYKLAEAITALREALAEQAEQEPVAWIKLNEDGVYIEDVTGFPVYAAPVQQVDLTDDEIERALDAAKVPELPDGYKSVDLEIARAVIAADREKNK